jgi:plasmid replication initiation protein
MNTAIEIQYNKDSLVVQANELIRARKDDLTLAEAKLIKLAVSQIAANDSEFLTYSCHITELANFLGIDQRNMYRDIDKLTDSILTKRVFLIDKKHPTKRNGEPNFNKFQWVSNCRYEKPNIIIKLNPELKPYLLGLDKLFTKYGYKCILNLPTTYAISLFELLASYEYIFTGWTNPKYSPASLYPHIPRDNNELIFSIDRLKNYFNLADKYPNPSDFIKRVIEPSVKAINDHTNSMYLSYRTAKEGRKINYVLFKLNAWEDEDFTEFIAKYYGTQFIQQKLYYSGYLPE